MKMYKKPISRELLNQYLAVPDLTQDGVDHAVSLLYQKVKSTIEKQNPESAVMVYRGDPATTVEDNYDNLLIPKDNLSRSSVYTHYV